MTYTMINITSVCFDIVFTFRDYVFIKSITVEGNNLIITNERNSKYQLDLNSLEVKVIQGSLVEETKFTR